MHTTSGIALSFYRKCNTFYSTWHTAFGLFSPHYSFSYFVKKVHVKSGLNCFASQKCLFCAAI